MGTSVTLQQQQTVADPGYVDLAKKYDLKDYVVLSRELALHKIATATCLTDRVYWALILTSCCGRDVREGCFVRKEDTGRLVTDERNQLYPLRIKHLIQILKLNPAHDRIHVSRAIRKLKEQGCIDERGAEKVWYPVLDPKRLPAERKQGGSKIRYNPAYTFLPAFLRKTLQTAETVSKNVVNSATTINRIQTLTEGYKNALSELQEHYKQVVGNALSEECIIISEEIEDIEDKEHTHTPSVSVEEAPKPEPTNGVCAPASFEQTREPEKLKSPKSPAFDPKPFWETFWATYSQTKDARRQDAWEWWRDNVKSAEYAAEILDGLNRHIASDQWQRKIGLPDAINFLLKHRYKERPLPASAVAPPQTKSARQAEALAQFAAKIREQPS